MHTNAYWELSANRRDIWMGDDSTGEAKLRSMWNRAIMSDLLAPLYSYLIRHLFKQHKHTLLPTASRQQRDAAVPLDLAENPNFSNLMLLLPFPVPFTHFRVIAECVYPLLQNDELLYR